MTPLEIIAAIRSMLALGHPVNPEIARAAADELQALLLLSDVARRFAFKTTDIETLAGAARDYAFVAEPNKKMKHQ